jgi:PAS domain S-box-containing protein
VPHWGRILLGGLGCFLLAWTGLELADKLGGPPLWLADAFLIFLVLHRSGRVVDGLLAGGAGILVAYVLVARAFVAPALLVTVASLLHVAIGRFLVIRFAPAAPRLETPAALAHLLLWCALLSPLAGALVMSGVALAGDGSLPLAQAFVSWWGANAVGTAILLPPLLALVHAPPVDLGAWRHRWGEALLVLGLAILVTAMGRHSSGFPLLLGLPIVLWAALRLDFRTTSLLSLLLGLAAIVAATVRVWPFAGQAQETTPLTQELQAYLLVIVVPALFASLYARQQRAADHARLVALDALQAVMDAVPSAVMTLTQGGKVVGLWNRGAERIFGWRKAEVEGHDPPFVAPEQAAHDASLKSRVLAGNEIQNHPAQRRERTGEVRDLVINAAPQRDAEGAITGIIAVMEDVTDRRRLESSREQNRAHLAAILDAVADPIITIDEEGNITSFSRAAEGVFGYRAPEVIGRNVKMLMPEPHRGQHDAYLRRYRETGVKHIIGTSRQFAARRKDGTTFPAEITISEAWLDGRRIFAGIVRDLSAKPAVAAMPATPAPAPDQARFLSRIAHDLRQPLHALGLMAGALERRAKDPDTREIADDLSRLVRQVESTFENIVDWIRIENGQIGVSSTAFPAGDVLAAMAQEFAPEAERRDLSFRSVPARAAIECDPVLLRRILRQLLDNAIKYTPSGTVLLGARRRGSMLRLVVADSGIGIPADQQDAIFTEYNQLDAGRELGGLGLGLAIARRLAALAGLAIGVRSAPGKGSQFWIDVPLAG